MPERSFFYKKKQFPVCARCSGTFIGHLVAILLFLTKRQMSFKNSCFFIGIMGVDWGIQEIGIKKSTNIRRLVTGFCGGLGLFNIYGLLLRKIMNQIIVKKG